MLLSRSHELVSLDRDRAVKNAQTAALVAHDQVLFWTGRDNPLATANARTRMNDALDELLALGVGR